ncbi:hypothetical protein Tco_0858620 [Tanacetum coccineum]|uniref:Uncharacterized protein n=1 Tax=Tanacetum coccineum TaxID=301880 RepID=A0ABQ5BCL3_9ASTR
MKAICNLDVPMDSKAPKPSSQTKEVPQGKKPGAKSGLRRKQSSKHTSKSKTKASKSKTSQSKKDTQSSSAKDKSSSLPSPPTPVVGKMHKEAHQAAGGPTSLGATSEEGAHPQLSSRSNPSVLVDKTKSAGDGLKTTHTESDMEIELPGDLKEIPTKLETFTSTISSLTSQVAELKNIQWELPAKFQAIPALVSSVQKKLQTLDSLPSLLNKVTNDIK